MMPPPFTVSRLVSGALATLIISHRALHVSAIDFNHVPDDRYAKTFPGTPDNNTDPKCQWPKGNDHYKAVNVLSWKEAADFDAAKKGLEHLKNLPKDATLSDETGGGGTRMYSANEKGIPSCSLLSATLWIFGNSGDKVPVQTGIDAFQKILDTCKAKNPGDAFMEPGKDVAGGSMFVKPNEPLPSDGAWWPYVVLMSNNDGC